MTDNKKNMYVAGKQKKTGHYHSSVHFSCLSLFTSHTSVDTSRFGCEQSSLRPGI